MLGPPKQFEPAQKLLGRETPNSAPRLQNARCGGPPFTARQMTGRSGWRCSGRHPACSESPKKPGCLRSSRKRWSYRASIGCDSPTCTGKLRNPLPSAAAGPFARKTPAQRPQPHSHCFQRFAGTEPGAMGAMRRPFYTLKGRMYSHTPVMTGLLSCTGRYLLGALAGGDRRRCGIYRRGRPIRHWTGQARPVHRRCQAH